MNNAELTKRVEELDRKVQRLVAASWAIGAVAAVFGVSGGFGAIALRGLHEELETASKRIEDANNKIGELSGATTNNKKALDDYTEDKKRELDETSKEVSGAWRVKCLERTVDYRTVGADKFGWSEIDTGISDIATRLVGVSAYNYNNNMVYLDGIRLGSRANEPVVDISTVSVQLKRDWWGLDKEGAKNDVKVRVFYLEKPDCQ